MTTTTLIRTENPARRSNGGSHLMPDEAPRQSLDLPSRSSYFPFAEKGICFTIPDDSMEPKIDKGSYVFVRLGLEPNPGDFVVFTVKGTGEPLFRRFHETTDSVSLELSIQHGPLGAYSYSRDEWPSAVDVIGVANSFETPLRTLDAA